MDDRRKDFLDPKRPLRRNRFQQLQTHNVPTDDVENTDGTNYSGDLLFGNKPKTVPRITERMPQRNEMEQKDLLYTNPNPQGEQNKTKKIFKAWTDKKAYDMVLQFWVSQDFDIAKKGNFLRETESLLIATQNNAIRTNYIKAKIDSTQQNSKYRLCGEKDETINHILSEWRKFAQKNDHVGKVIHSELCKKFIFDQRNK